MKRHCKVKRTFCVRARTARCLALPLGTACRSLLVALAGSLSVRRAGRRATADPHALRAEGLAVHSHSCAQAASVVEREVLRRTHEHHVARELCIAKYVWVRAGAWAWAWTGGGAWTGAWARAGASDSFLVRLRAPRLEELRSWGRRVPGEKCGGRKRSQLQLLKKELRETGHESTHRLLLLKRDGALSRQRGVGSRRLGGSCAPGHRNGDQQR